MQTIEHASLPAASFPIMPRQPVDAPSYPTRDDRRVDLEGQVVLQDPIQQTTVTEHTQNVSETGMFVKTDSLSPPGTWYRFELDLANGLESIQGQAEVVWVRHRSEGLFRPAGFGLRFVDLDPESRMLIRWSVDHRTRDLRKTLCLDAVETRAPARSDLDDLRMELEGALDDGDEASVLAELRAEVDVALQEALGSSRRFDVARSDTPPLHEALDEIEKGWRSAAEPRKRRIAAGRTLARIDWGLWRIASAVPLVPLAALCFYLLSPTPELAAATPQRLATAPAELAIMDLGPVDAGAAFQDATGDVAGELEDTVKAWADAWSKQRARTYLAYYSPDFRPPNALSREDWEAMREARILKPRYIEIEVDDLEIEILSPQRARVIFAQTYGSDRYRDTVRKTLDLVRGEEGWQIAAELVEADLLT